MSLIPFILDLADELHEFSRCLANGIDINDFGFGLYTGTEQQQQPQQQQQQQTQTSPRRSRATSFSSFWMPSKRHHPYNRIKTACCAKTGEETVTNPEKSDASSSSIGGTPGKSASYSVVNKNGFQVSMNVKQFAPNELSVKTIDNCIVVEGRHDDKEDGHGVISRHFVRKYMLPKGYDPNDVLSTLSSDGILTVKAPPPPAAKNDEPNERVIEIQPTPGPTPVMVSSAKDTPAKETSKKLAASPLTRSEYQLPEKRQKLDLPSEPEPEEITEATVPIPSENESNSASAPAAGTEIDSNDVEMEKADEQTTDFVVKQTEQQEQQTSDVAEIENDVEKKAEIIEQAEKLLEKEQELILDETEEKLLDECISESNRDSKNVCEKMEESCSAADATETSENVNKTPAESKTEESNEILIKMDVDEENEPQIADDDEKMVNSESVVAKIKTADSETKTAVKAAANDDSAKGTNTKPDTTNNTDTAGSNTTTTNDNTTNNNNNSSTKTNNSSKIIATTNNSSSEVVKENSAENNKSGNGVVTGINPADITNSADSETDVTNTTLNNTKDLAGDKAESAAKEAVGTETAVLSTETTTATNVIDDISLLKAATADPTSITNNTDENEILTESIDGITTTDDLSTTNTTTTTVDSVECSLFAKKTHLGNGNNTTATPIVGTEEMAN